MSDARSSELTCDTLLGGELLLWQHRRGYRFGLDALLLATDLPSPGEAATVVELGAGQGAVALTMAHQNPTMEVIAVERQPSLLELLRRNIAENQLDNVTVIAGDLRNYRELLEPHSADLVVANPPYYEKGSRRPSSNKQKAAAHHELHGGLCDFVAAAAYVLKQRGWLQMIAPPIRLPDALAAAEGTDLRPASLRFYHSRQDESAYLVEGRWRRGGAADFEIRPPLFIYEADKLYSPEVAARIGREQR